MVSKWKKMLTIRSTDEVWNLPYTISLSNGFLELKKQSSWLPLHVGKSHFNISQHVKQFLPLMDQLFTLESTHNTLLQVPPQPHTWIHHPRFLRNPLLPQNLSQWITWMHYCKCRKQTHSANAFLRDYWMAKAPHHEFDTFTHVKGLLYKHVTDTGKKFLTLVIPKS